MSSVLRLYDVNNWVRNQFEVDKTGLALKNLFYDAFHYPGPQIWVSDGMNSRKARRAIFPDYKEGRQRPPDNFFETLAVFKNLLTMTPAITIEKPETEADDVIATICRSQPVLYPNLDILIYSTDKDFAALHTDRVKQNREGLNGVDANEVRLYKCLVGDTSDNIKGIPGFGAKAWGRLDAESKRLWIEFLENGQDHIPEAMGVTGKPADWVRQNADLLRAYWKVTGFFHVDDINNYMKVGTPNLYEAEKILRGMFLIGDSDASTFSHSFFGSGR